MFSLEYQVEEDGAPGSVPEFGGIFMFSSATRKECFRRKLLGLPSALANFVKRIKAGMVLFVFDFEKRELYGVFRACSDGALNIVPYAFTSSGKQFPAQVRFTIIWHCSPLPENEFRDAIIENYFSDKKFKFGLSKDQVYRLLWLFSTRKLENRVPWSLIGNEKGISENDRFNQTYREQFVEKDSTAPSDSVKYNRYSRHRRRLEDRRSLESYDNNLENSHEYGIATERTGTPLEGRRMGDDNMCSMEYKVPFDLDLHQQRRRAISDYNMRGLLNCLGEPNELDTQDFLAEVGRDIDDGKMGHRHAQSDSFRIESYDNNLENSHGYGTATEHLGTPLEERRIGDDNMCSLEYKVPFDFDLHQHRRQVIGDYNLRGSLNYSGGPNEHETEDVLAEVRRDIDDGKIGHSHAQSDSFRIPGPVESFKDPGTGIRRTSSDQRVFVDRRMDYKHKFECGPEPIISCNQISKPYMNDRIEIGRSIDCGVKPTVTARYLDNRLDKPKSMDEGKVLVQERREIPAERIFSHLDYAEKANNHDKFFSGISMKSQTSVDHCLGTLDERERLTDNDILLKSEGADNAHAIGSSVGLLLSSGYDYLCQPKQDPSFYSTKPVSDAAYYSLNHQYHPKPSLLFPNTMEKNTYETSHQNRASYPMTCDSVLTRAVPYDPEFPDVNDSSYLVQNYLHPHGHVENNFPASITQSPQYHTDDVDSRSQENNAFAFVRKDPYYRDLHNHSRGRIKQSLLSCKFREKMEKPLTRHETYGDMSAVSRSHLYERQNIRASVKFDERAIAPLDRFNHKVLGNETDLAFSDCEDRSVNYDGMGHSHSGSYLENSNNYDVRSYRGSALSPSDPKKKRSSVFARLSLASKGQVEGNGGDNDELYATVDQVMDSIFESLDAKITNLNKPPFGKQHCKDETLGIEGRDKRRDKIEFDKSHETSQIAGEDEGETANFKETRLVDFKRRSELRINQYGENRGVKGINQKPEGKKRRKLIRPDFGKNEKSKDALDQDGVQIQAIPL